MHSPLFNRLSISLVVIACSVRVACFADCYVAFFLRWRRLFRESWGAQ